MAFNAHADIYKHVDENGVVHFTNNPSGKGYKKVISEGGKYKKSRQAKQDDYQQIVQSMSQRYNVEPSLVKAVITVESAWNASAVSRKGAMGLMQLMPLTAKEMNVKNPFDPKENIKGGVKYLRYLLDRFNGNIELALAAYNAGPQKIEKFKGVPPIRETRRYVKKVLSLYNGSGFKKTSSVIYKIKYKDGTVLYTNTPIHYKGSKLSKF